MKHTRNTVMTVAASAIILFVAITNLKLVLVLAGGILLYALVSRMCGPMGDQPE